MLVVKKLRGFDIVYRTTQDIYFIFSYRLHHSSHVQTNSQNTGSTYGYMCYNQLLLLTACYMHVVKKLRGFDIVYRTTQDIYFIFSYRLHHSWW